MSMHEDFDPPETPDDDPLIEGMGDGRVLAGCDAEVGQRGCKPNAEHMSRFVSLGSDIASTLYVVAKRIAFHEYMQHRISERRRAGSD